MREERECYGLKIEISSFQRGESSTLTVYDATSPLIRGGENNNFQKIKIIIEEDDLETLFIRRIEGVREF